MSKTYTDADTLKEAIYKDLQIDDHILYEWKTKDYSISPEKSKSLLSLIASIDTVLIFGDYDCDGICASYIAYSCIHKLYPQKNVEVFLPTRAEGYGINDRMIHAALESQRSGNTLVITVDTGIAAKDKINQLIDNGIKVAITDHHEFKSKDGMSALPRADYMVDPKCAFLKNPFTETNYCGAAVIYKLFEPYLEPATKREMMCYAGLASVADCIEMREGTWQLVHNTLDMFHKGLAPYSLVLLLSMMGQGIETIREDSFGYYLGPAFNAPGRLDDPIIVFNYLKLPCEQLANKIVELNNKRKELRDEEVEIVKAQVIAEGKDKVSPIWIYTPNLHTGIVGIVAGHIAEEFHAPTIVLTDKAPGVLGGSARSYENFNIYEYLYDHADLISQFGGHPSAAGLSMTMDGYEKIQQFVTGNKAKEKISLGKRIVPELIPIATEIVNELRPFGEYFKEPLFHTDLDLVHGPFHVSFLGKEKNHIRIEDLDKQYKIIHFFHKEYLKKQNPPINQTQFCAIGHVHDSYFRGVFTPEMNIENILPVELASKIDEEMEIS